MPAHSPVATPANLPSLDHLVEEVAVAININGINHAVMMATPDDLDDFAVGFLFGEVIIRHNHEVHDIQVAPAEQGIVLDMTIANRSLAALTEHKRRLTGVTGCGICGVAAVEQALPALSVLPLTPPLDAEGRILHCREDIGRHNALDNAAASTQCVRHPGGDQPLR